MESSIWTEINSCHFIHQVIIWNDYLQKMSWYLKSGSTNTDGQDLSVTYGRNSTLKMILKLKWVPENLYTFSIIGHIVNVYKFSETHFIFNYCFFSPFMKLKQEMSILEFFYFIVPPSSWHFPDSCFCSRPILFHEQLMMLFLYRMLAWIVAQD